MQKYCNVTELSDGDFLQEQLINRQGQVSLTTTLTQTICKTICNICNIY